MTPAPGRIVACLENAQTAVQDALDECQNPDWGDWEETITDAAYGHVEAIRRLLDAIETRLHGPR
jgi:hypothetical protein